MSVYICIKKPHLCFFLETSSRLEGAAVLNDDANHFRLVFSACDQGHGPVGGAAKHAVKINFGPLHPRADGQGGCRVHARPVVGDAMMAMLNQSCGALEAFISLFHSYFFF